MAPTTLIIIGLSLVWMARSLNNDTPFMLTFASGVTVSTVAIMLKMASV